jgi:hypothetical protein
MKLLDQHITTIISTTTLSTSTTSIPMVVGLRKIGKRISGHPRKKEARRPLTIGQTSITREGACQALAEARSSIYTTRTMAATTTIAQKIAQYSSNPRGRWSNTPTRLSNNPHPD